MLRRIEQAFESLGSNYQFENNGLQFKANSEFNVVQRAIVEDILFSKSLSLHELQTTSSIKNSIAKNKLDYKLDEIVLGMTSVITDGFNTLKTKVAPEVDMLATEINELVSVRMKAKETEHGYMVLDESPKVMKSLHYKDLASSIGNEETITTALKEKFNYTGKDGNSATMHFINSLKRLSIPTLDSSYSSAQSEYTSVLRSILGDKTPEYISGSFATAEVYKEAFATKVFYNTIETYLTALPKLKKSMDTISVEAVKDVAYKMYERVQWMLNIASYYFWNLKDCKALIISDDLYNGDMLEDISEEDFTEKDVKLIMRVFYNPDSNDPMNSSYPKVGLTIPENGLTTEQIKSLKQKAYDHVAHAKVKFDRDYKEQYKQTFAIAFNQTALQYIDDRISPYSVSIKSGQEGILNSMASVVGLNSDKEMRQILEERNKVIKILERAKSSGDKGMMDETFKMYNTKSVDFKIWQSRSVQFLDGYKHFMKGVEYLCDGKWYSWVTAPLWSYLFRKEFTNLVNSILNEFVLAGKVSKGIVFTPVLNDSKEDTIPEADGKVEKAKEFEIAKTEKCTNIDQLITRLKMENMFYEKYRKEYLEVATDLKGFGTVIPKITQHLEVGENNRRLKRTITNLLEFQQSYQKLFDRYAKQFLTPIMTIGDEALDTIFVSDKTKQQFKQNILPEMMTQIKNTKLLNVEQVLYKFILTLKYPDSIVSDIHKRLNVEYADIISKKELVGQEDLLLADVSVMTDILLDYIFTNEVEKK